MFESQLRASSFRLIGDFYDLAFFRVIARGFDRLLDVFVKMSDVCCEDIRNRKFERFFALVVSFFL